MNVLTLLALIHSVVSLNILLSTTDSWVTKNIRSLYHDLTLQNHNVILVGPLYQSVHSVNDNKLISNASIADGGDFGHLLPSNQIYYHNLNKLDRINDASSKNPKRLLKKEDMEAINEEFNTNNLKSNMANNTNQFGFDPLDTNCVYVNSNNPINILSSFLFNIKPQYFPNFEIDLAIVGPIEGHSAKTTTLSDEITKFLLAHDIPTVSITTVDADHMYYNNKYLTLKNNKYAKVMQFQNSRITSFINKLQNSMTESNPRLLPKYHGIRLTLPSYLNSNCKLHSKFQFNTAKRLQNVTYNQFEFSEDSDYLQHSKSVSLKLAGEDELIPRSQSNFVIKKNGIEDTDDIEDMFFVDKESNYYKYKMKLAKSMDRVNAGLPTAENEDMILENCDISISVNYLFKLDSSAYPKE